MIDTKLQTFISLCETKSYTKTAELLYVTQPSVTHHIKTLEKTYNIKLFNTSNKNFSLTPQGQLLYQYALQLEALDIQFERMLSASQNESSEITFAITPNVQNAYLKNILAPWAKKNKKFRFTVLEESYETILNDFQSGKIDFAIIDNNFNKRSFQSIDLFKTKLILAVNKEHPFAENKKMNFNALLNERFILDISGTGKRDFLTNELKLKNRNLHELVDFVEVNDPKTVVDMVIGGAGISVFYQSEIEDQIKSGKLIPIEIAEVKDPVEFCLIYSKNHLASKMIEEIAADFVKIHKEINYLKYTSSLK